MTQTELEQIARKLLARNRKSAGAIMLELLQGEDIASALCGLKRGRFIETEKHRKRIVRGRKGKQSWRIVESLSTKLANVLPAREDNRRIMPDDFDVMVEKLPVREQLIISLAYAGMTGAQIAAQTGYSPMTVSRSFGIIREKFSELLVD